MAAAPEGARLAGAAADPLLPRIGRVRRRRRDAPRVWTLEVEAPELTGAPLPGQFNMLTAFGVGEIPVSLSGDPARPERLVHTIRAVGPVSSALARLRSGDLVGVRGPFGAGWPIEELRGRDVVVVAGGLGLAPLRPALCALLARRKHYGRVLLLYGARSPAELLFSRELERWSRRRGLEVHMTVDHAAPEWAGDVGVVTALIERLALDEARSAALVCGPEVMMRHAIAALGSARVDARSIWLSLERNMKCAVALCGRCQLGTVLVCRDGPVFRYDRVRGLLAHREI